MAAAVGVDIDAHGLSHTDGVCQLHKHLVGHTGSHHVLGDIAGGVCCAAVYLAGILAREGTAAVCAASSVGVDDNLASGQSGVAVRTADDKLARRVDVVFDAVVHQLALTFAGVGLCLSSVGQTVVEESAQFVAGGFLDARDEDVDDILADLGKHLLVRLFLSLAAVVLRLDKRVVLCRDHNGVDAHGLVLLVVFHGHLTLGVGAQIGHHLAFLADLCQGVHDQMRQVEGGGHVVVGLIGGVAKHHTLVAGALLFLFLAADALVDVAALLMDSREDATGVVVELIFGFAISDALDGFARHGLQVDVGVGVHLAHDHYLSGGDERLHGAVSLRVIGQELVEDGIGNLVGHLVGMSFRNGF